MIQTAQQSEQRTVQQPQLLFVNLDLNEKGVEFLFLRMD
jgi:hypothetical protein